MKGGGCGGWVSRGRRAGGGGRPPLRAHPLASLSKRNGGNAVKNAGPGGGEGYRRRGGRRGGRTCPPSRIRIAVGLESATPLLSRSPYTAGSTARAPEAAAAAARALRHAPGAAVGASRGGGDRHAAGGGARGSRLLGRLAGLRRVGLRGRHQLPEAALGRGPVSQDGLALGGACETERHAAAGGRLVGRAAGGRAGRPGGQRCAGRTRAQDQESGGGTTGSTPRQALKTRLQPTRGPFHAPVRSTCASIRPRRCASPAAVCSRWMATISALTRSGKSPGGRR